MMYPGFWVSVRRSGSDVALAGAVPGADRPRLESIIGA